MELVFLPHLYAHQNKMYIILFIKNRTMHVKNVKADMISNASIHKHSNILLHLYITEFQWTYIKWHLCTFCVVSWILK